MLRRRLDPYHAIHSPACDKDATDKEKKQRKRLMKIYVLNVLFILLDLWLISKVTTFAWL